MLRDIPEYYLRYTNPISALVAGMHDPDWSNKRVAKGVYEAHFNFNYDIEELTVPEDFNSWGPFHPPIPQFYVDGKKTNNSLSSYLEETKDFPPDYGVADNWEQILAKYPVIETDPRPVCISFVRIIREWEPQEGGWRWHKWGEYIGTYEPKHEYIYDEDIDEVIVFHIHRLKD